MLPTQYQRRRWTMRYMEYMRLNSLANPINPEYPDEFSYHDYLLKYELTEEERRTYLPFLSPFIRKRNQIIRLMKPRDIQVVTKKIKEQISLNRLPREYLVFLREYYPQ